MKFVTKRITLVSCFSALGFAVFAGAITPDIATPEDLIWIKAWASVIGFFMPLMWIVMKQGVKMISNKFASLEANQQRIEYKVDGIIENSSENTRFIGEMKARLERTEKDIETIINKH